MKKNDMNMDSNLKNIDWREFNLDEIFADIKRGKRLKTDNHIPGKIPYISSSASNNGADGFIGNEGNVRIFSNCLTLANSGSIGTTFYHSYSFVASDHVTKLKNRKLNRYAYLFISIITNRFSRKYGYNREINNRRIKREKIILPVNAQGAPDYAFMEAYMRQKEQEKLHEYQAYITNRLNELEGFKNVAPLQEKEWDEFFLNKIFPGIKRGKRLKKADHKAGKVPYVSSTSSNNGVDSYIGNQVNVRIFDDCLSIANSGSVGSCFYHPYKFVASDHVTKLKNNSLSKYSYQFISVLLSRLAKKYSYNREINDKRMKREKIMLPVTDNHNPDYAYM